MSLINKLKEALFGKPAPQPGPWFLVGFTEAAIDKSVGGDANKEIRLVYNSFPTNRVFSYSEAKLNELKRQGYFVYDSTRGQEIPKQSTLMPTKKKFLGYLMLEAVEGRLSR